MNRLKVLQVNKLYFPVTGGIEKIVQQLSEGLNDRTKLKVLVCQERRGRTTDEVINKVRLRRSSSRIKLASMPLSFRFLKDYRRMARQADIIHIHMPFPLADVACLLAGGKQGKIVLSWHSEIVRQKRLMFLYQPFLHSLLKRSSAIIVATKRQLEASSELRKYRKKCVVIPFGIDEELYQAGQRYQKEKQKEEENAPLRLLFAGRLVRYKGIDILLRALAKTKNTFLTIVGSGPEKETLCRIAEQNNLKHRVLFLGEITKAQLMAEYANCDVFVLPSRTRNEAFGLVQLEAMAFGKPVINTVLNSGVPEVSIHKKTGLSVRPGDISGLAKAIQSLEQDRKLLHSYGRAAAERAAGYRQEEMVNKVWKLYQRLE